MDFKLNYVLLVVIIALVLIIKYRYSTRRTILVWRGMRTHPSHPPGYGPRLALDDNAVLEDDSVDEQRGSGR